MTYEKIIDNIKDELNRLDRVDAPVEDYIEALEEVLEEVQARYDAAKGS